jgi:hypothetical protein
MASFNEKNEVVVLKTSCVVLLRAPSSENLGGGGGGTSSALVPHSALSPDDRQLYLMPTLVNLHVMHGRLWWSLPIDKTTPTSASAASATPQQDSFLGGRRSNGRSLRSSNFKLLCDLSQSETSLVSTLVPNGRAHNPTALTGGYTKKSYERLVLSLSCANVTTHEPMKIVLFPKDKPHFVRIASVLLYYIEG